MNNKLNIYSNKKFKYKKSIKDIKKILKYISKETEHSPIEVSIWFVDSKRIKELNNEHRNKNSSTDVLSFPHNEIEDKRLYIGDIFINIEIVDEQAESINSDSLTEIKFLSMHGMLHLIGYDHMNKNDEDKMTAKQREIFINLKIREW